MSRSSEQNILPKVPKKYDKQNHKKMMRLTRRAAFMMDFGLEFLCLKFSDFLVLISFPVAIVVTILSSCVFWQLFNSILVYTDRSPL